jgi:hypothetical protein
VTLARSIHRRSDFFVAHPFACRCSEETFAPAIYVFAVALDGLGRRYFSERVISDKADGLTDILNSCALDESRISCINQSCISCGDG